MIFEKVKFTDKIFCLFLFIVIPFISDAQEVDTTLYNALKPRAIGPAGMSGRVTTIDVLLANPDVMYIGTASGGLWKSESGGTAWEPIFDKYDVASIGALAINQKNPDVIWVGTGEGNPRNSQTSGNGVYKSIDGGKNWVHLGLEKTRNIHRIIIHRDNPEIVWVGAQGSAWGESTDRGVFKTTDGGKTWRKVLYVNEKTGIADLIVDPVNPDKLIAAMWEFRRWPWFFNSGGPGSGLYISYDGGDSWEKRTDKNGLPEGNLGRMGLAIAPSNTDIIYALVESKKNALYVSKDGGFKWKKVSDKNIGNRPFYYADIYVDPLNENRIYNLYSIVTVSEDGGKTFSTMLAYGGSSTDIHPDHHAWWVHPDDPTFLINGNDGGLAISRDRGNTWRFVENLPLAQFYHINYDMEFPYNVYGGMQDNGSWKGPAYVWKAGGIRNSYWQEVFFGDGFDVVPDPDDSRYGYAMSQGGFLGYYDSETGRTQMIRPVHPEGEDLRFNWNAAIAQDPHDNSTIYYGSQFVHKSTDKGQNWSIISPDLTTDDPEKQKQIESGGLTYDVTQAENYCSIITIAPSTLDKDVIWVGTDDGNLQLTTDGGGSWEKLNKRIKDMPVGAWIPQIVPSAHSAGEAFVIVNNYRKDDWTPFLYHTTDFGKSWVNLLEGNKVWGYTLSVVQDPVTPDLLFVGTEFGLYFTLDKGQSWIKWGETYPTVSTMDLKIHPREHDLIIGTFGRAAYIIDDIRPLRDMAMNSKDGKLSGLNLFEPPVAYLSARQQASGSRFAGYGIFAGENRRSGGSITYYLESLKPDTVELDGVKEVKEAKSDSLWVEFFNEGNERIRRIKISASKGFNRFFWDLERKGERYPGTPKPVSSDTSDWRGPNVLPGKYKVRMHYGEWVDSTSIEVKLDPRIEFNESALVALDKDVDKALALVAGVTGKVDQLNEIKKSISLVEKMLSDNDISEDIKERTKAAKDTIKYFIELINAPEDVQGIQRSPDILSTRLSMLNYYISSAIDRPNQSQQIMLNQVTEEVEKVVGQIDEWLDEEWEETQQFIEAARLSPFKKENEQ
ncbi:MAG: hypothetical protein PVH48_02215 [Cyclobacteriaceae bacterium]|jgi:hypothetical protein